MHLINFRLKGRSGTALQQKGGALVGCFADDSHYPGSVADLIRRGADALAGAARRLAEGIPLDADRIEYLPPLPAPGRILCLGLNYKDHAAETGLKLPDVQTTIVLLSEAMTLAPGDVLVMGTPSGVGFTRTPPVFMKAADLSEVEIEGVGLLRNRVVDEAESAGPYPR